MCVFVYACVCLCVCVCKTLFLSGQEPISPVLANEDQVILGCPGPCEGSWEGHGRAVIQEMKLAVLLRSY